MTYPQAKAEATRIAAEYGENCYIAECAIYARGDDEYGEGPFIVGGKGVFAIVYARLKEFGGKVVGVVNPDGSHFCNDLGLVKLELKALWKQS